MYEAGGHSTFYGRDVPHEALKRGSKEVSFFAIVSTELIFFLKHSF